MTTPAPSLAPTSPGIALSEFKILHINTKNSTVLHRMVLALIRNDINGFSQNLTILSANNQNDVGVIIKELNSDINITCGTITNFPLGDELIVNWNVILPRREKYSSGSQYVQWLVCGEIKVQGSVSMNSSEVYAGDFTVFATNSVVNDIKYFANCKNVPRLQQNTITCTIASLAVLFDRKDMFEKILRCYSSAAKDIDSKTTIKAEGGISVNSDDQTCIGSIEGTRTITNIQQLFSVLGQNMETWGLIKFRQDLAKKQEEERQRAFRVSEEQRRALEDEGRRELQKLIIKRDDLLIRSKPQLSPNSSSATVPNQAVSITENELLQFIEKIFKLDKPTCASYSECFTVFPDLIYNLISQNNPANTALINTIFTTIIRHDQNLDLLGVTLKEISVNSDLQDSSINSLIDLLTECVRLSGKNQNIGILQGTRLASGFGPLHTLVKFNHLDAFRHAIEKDISVEYKTNETDPALCKETNETVLEYAARQKKLEFVNAYLQVTENKDKTANEMAILQRVLDIIIKRPTFIPIPAPSFGVSFFAAPPPAYSVASCPPPSHPPVLAIGSPIKTMLLGLLKVGVKFDSTKCEQSLVSSVASFSFHEVLQRQITQENAETQWSIAQQLAAVFVNARNIGDYNADPFNQYKYDIKIALAEFIQRKAEKFLKEAPKNKVNKEKANIVKEKLLNAVVDLSYALQHDRASVPKIDSAIAKLFEGDRTVWRKSGYSEDCTQILTLQKEYKEYKEYNESFMSYPHAPKSSAISSSEEDENGGFELIDFEPEITEAEHKTIVPTLSYVYPGAHAPRATTEQPTSLTTGTTGVTVSTSLTMFSSSPSMTLPTTISVSSSGSSLTSSMFPPVPTGPVPHSTESISVQARGETLGCQERTSNPVSAATVM